MIPSSIIYLDATFIVEAYESKTNQPVPVKVTKTEDISGGFSAGIFHAGASTKETKEFPITTKKMYEDVKEELAAFPSVDLTVTQCAELPEYFWTEGILYSGTFEQSREGTVLSRDDSFMLEPSPSKGSGCECLVLITNDIYFSTGYDQVLQHVRGAAIEFSVPIKALIKVLAYREKPFTPLCTPLVMQKISK